MNVCKARPPEAICSGRGRPPRAYSTHRLHNLSLQLVAVRTLAREIALQLAELVLRPLALCARKLGALLCLGQQLSHQLQLGLQLANLVRGRLCDGELRRLRHNHGLQRLHVLTHELGLAAVADVGVVPRSVQKYCHPRRLCAIHT